MGPRSELAQSPSPTAAWTPTKPLHIVVPFAAGGAVDTLARLLANKLTSSLGQPVVVDNRPGAAGNLAADVVAKGPPDGSVVLLTTNGLAISPSLYRTLPFDVTRDFTPVTQVVASQLLLVARNDLPAGDVRGLAELARQTPGGLNYGMTGVGNPLHLTLS